MGVLRRIGALLLSIAQRMNPQNRTQIWGAIALFWIGSLIVSILVGVFWMNALVRNIVANLVADLLVAAVIFIAVDLIFGFSRRQEERTEAISKAMYMLGSEITMNKKELERIIGDFEKGRTPAPDPKLETENWELFVQGPLVNVVPSDLLWVLKEAYWFPKKALETYEFRRGSTHPGDAPKVGRQLLPEFRQALVFVKEADEALRAGYVNEQARDEKEATSSAAG